MISQNNKKIPKKNEKHLTKEIWKIKNNEDKLLVKYQVKTSSRIYAEVSIGGSSAPTIWPHDSTIRRIDAVCFPNSTHQPGIFPFAQFSEQFYEDLNSNIIELIEIKKELNRAAIGQVIAGTRMFKRQYERTPSRKIILCQKADKALIWVCKKEGIKIEIEK